MKRGCSGLLPCFIGLAFIRATCMPCLQLTCRAAEWPAGTKGGFSRGYLWSNGKARLSKKPFSNRPWPLNLSSTPEVHSFESLCPRRASESAPLSPTAEHVSRPHMHSCGGLNALAANDHISRSRAYFIGRCRVLAANISTPRVSPCLCSDGAGRSGTYILIDMVLNRLAKGKDQWLLFHSFLLVFRRRPSNAEASRLLTEDLGDTLEGVFSKAGDKKEVNKEKEPKKENLKKKKKTISNYLFKPPY